MSDLISRSGPPAPFTAFNFEISIVAPGLPTTVGGFAECDGLELSMEVKTIRQGGDGGRQIRLLGPMAFGNLTLKRGMVPLSLELWRWMSGYADPGRQRARAEVTVAMHSGGRDRVTADPVQQAVFRLGRCLPIKLKAPALNAKDGLVAIEELQLAYETIEMRPPESGTVEQSLARGGLR